MRYHYWPVSPTTAYKIGEKINDPIQMYMEDIFTVPVNIAGLPAMSIPCGLDNNSYLLDFSSGKRFDEQTIIKTAYTFEQNTEFHNLRPNLNV